MYAHSTSDMTGARARRGRAFGIAALLVACLILLAAPGASASVFDGLDSGLGGSPTITTDKPDYAPGETVQLSGSNWAPDEPIHITVNDNVGQTWTHERDVTAGADGSFSDSFDLPTTVIAEYKVTATGPVSGTATTTFTDGNVKVKSDSGRNFGYKVTSYTGSTDCSSGAGPELTHTADGNGTSESVGNADSILITANETANSPNASATFHHWDPEAGLVFASGYSVTDRTVCVVGFSGGGSKDLVGIYDATAPAVVSIVRIGSSPTNTSGSLSWTVTFSKPVSGVDTGDFALVSTGLTGSPAVTAATPVSPVNGRSKTYTVTASTGTGSGTLGLNLSDDDTIVDAGGNKLGGTGAGNGNFAGQVYAIDRAAPTIAASAVTLPDNNAYTADTWTNKSVRVTFTCTDTGGSGKATDTASGTTDVTAETSSSGTTVNSGGTCTDNAGNTASAASFGPVKIDQTRPSSAAGALAQYSSGTPITVDYSASDAGAAASPPSGSGVKDVELWVKKPGDSDYSLADTDTSPASASFSYSPPAGSGDGTYRFYTRAHDNAGNYEDPPASPPDAETLLDRQDPETTDNADSDWHNSDQTITLSATDPGAGDTPPTGSGVAGTHYKVDGGATQDGTSVSIPAPSDGSNDGQHTIEYWSVDKAANEETHHTVTVKIDKTNPSSSASSPTATNQSPFTVDYTASDQATLSGLSKVELYVRTPQSGTGYVLAATDNSPTGSGSFSYTPDAGEGTYRFYTVAYDAAGNVETSPVSYDTTTSVETGTPDASTIYDLTAPVTTDDADAGWQNSAVTVTLTPTDEAGGSGVDKTYYKVDSDPTFTEGTSVVIGANDGTHTITYYSVDKAGNGESNKTATVKIDTAAPTVAYTSASPDANANGWRKADVTATFTATDNLSGFAGPSPTKTGTATTSGEGTGVTVGSPAFTDLAGNTVAAGAAMSDAFKIDKTKPTLNPIVAPNPVTLGSTATVTSNAADPLSTLDSQSCGAINTSTVGNKSVTCTATDKADNSDSKTVSYSVQYGWDGFLQPINDTAHQTGLTQSRFKLGSTVPAKFALKNAAGQVVQQATNPTFSRTNRLRSCDTNATAEPTQSDLSPDGGASYSWDGSQYHYNWSTKGIKDPGVYRIYANLSDTTQRWVDICLW